MRLRARFIILAALVSVVGCDRSSGRLPPGGIAGLDGQYAGEAVLTWGRPQCSARTPYRMTVRNGNVYGEIGAAPSPVGRFETFVDSEGRIGTVARSAGNEVRIEGFFDRDRFDGSTKSNDCLTRLTLRRQPAS